MNGTGTSGLRIVLVSALFAIILIAVFASLPTI